MTISLRLRTFAAGLVLVLAPAALSAAEFRGQLHGAPRIGMMVLGTVVPATPDLVAALPAAPADGEKTWAPKSPINLKGRDYRAVIVASPTGARTLWLDRDGDGRFGTDECWPFPVGKDAVQLDAPWDNGIYRSFPLHVQLRTEPLRRRDAPEATPPPPPPGPADLSAIVYNFNVVYTGEVAVDGRALRVEFYPKPTTVAIDLLDNGMGLDANFDGKIERDLGEAENASGKIPVFRVGTRFLAVKSVAMATGAIVLEERPASDYTRFDAAPGQEMPDFAFVDFAGGTHRLADYRGSYVLLDFWGTWCGPCIAEMKALDPIYRQYHPRGFEIIGLNMEKTSGRLTAEGYAAATDKARKFITQAGHPWPQATQESIERVALEVIHVNQYPTTILLDPAGKVVARDVRSEALAALLAKLLP